MTESQREGRAGANVLVCIAERADEGGDAGIKSNPADAERRAPAHDRVGVGDEVTKVRARVVIEAALVFETQDRADFAVDRPERPCRRRRRRRHGGGFWSSGLARGKRREDGRQYQHERNASLT